MLLSDGALIQISYSYRRSKVIAHRLAYIPCPFPIEPALEGLNEYGLVDYIETFYTGDVDKIILRSQLRFDYDMDAMGEDHPCSHLTLVSPTCRIPVCAPVSVGEFFLFLQRSFYRDWELDWLSRRIGGFRRFPRALSEADELSMHMNWKAEIKWRENRRTKHSRAT